jgi:hypothetical protein
MDEDGFAESLKLDMKPVSDRCFRETKIKRPDEGSRQTTAITLWNRTVCLTSSPADNVFLYESRQKELRVFKRLRRQKTPANYRRELSVMERVLKEVEYVCQKPPKEQVSNVIAGHIKRSFLLASLAGSHLRITYTLYWSTALMGIFLHIPARCLNNRHGVYVTN